MYAMIETLLFLLVPQKCVLFTTRIVTTISSPRVIEQNLIFTLNTCTVILFKIGRNVFG